jgi:hypothetical protein
VKQIAVECWEEWRIEVEKEGRKSGEAREDEEEEGTGKALTAADVIVLRGRHVAVVWGPTLEVPLASSLGVENRSTNKMKWRFVKIFCMGWKQGSCNSIRASPVVLDLHMHLHFFICDAYADPGMWPSGPYTM